MLSKNKTNDKISSQAIEDLYQEFNTSSEGLSLEEAHLRLNDNGPNIVESSLSEMLVTFAIRTKLPFYKSMPSWLLIVFSLLSSLGVIIIPLTGFGEALFDFARVPLFLWLWIITVVIGYFVFVEGSKRIFFKRFEL